MACVARRSWLLGAAALPGALALAGCSDLGYPPLGGSRSPGRCVGSEEEIPEEDLETVPDGILVDPRLPDETFRFLSDSLAISPDGSMLAASEAFDRVILELQETAGVILWDTETGEVIRRIETPARGRIAWDPDGSRLAIGDGRRVDLVDLEGTHQRTLLGHELPKHRTAAITDLAFRPDGTQLATAGTDGTVRLWDLDPDACGSGHVLRPGRRNNGALSWSPDGTVLAVGAASSYSRSDDDNPPELWHPDTGRRSTVLDEVRGNVFALGHAPDGALLVVTHDPESLVVVGADGSVDQGPVTPSTWFADLAVGPGHRVALLGADDELLLWDRETGEETRQEIESTVGSMAWSLDESALFSLHRTEGVLAFDGTNWSSFDLP